MNKKKVPEMPENETKSIKETVKTKHTIIKEQIKQELFNSKEDDQMNATHKAICHFAALGFRNKEIAIQLNLTPGNVSQVVCSETGKYYIAKLQREMFVEDPQKMFMTEVPRAFRRVKKIISDPKAKHMEALAASKEMFDRALGKPVQEIKTEGSAIRTLIEMLDREMSEKKHTPQKSDQVVTAEFHEVETDDSQKDDLDRYLDDNLK